MGECLVRRKEEVVLLQQGSGVQLDNDGDNSDHANKHHHHTRVNKHQDNPFNAHHNNHYSYHDHNTRSNKHNNDHDNNTITDDNTDNRCHFGGA